jgi:thiamine-monophosphate kinase
MSASRSLGEFALIERYFGSKAGSIPAVATGIGDDCALLDVGTDALWAVTTDMLVERIHFLPAVDAESLGHKALAVNLSDLAACGATPRCFFLALALPAVDEAWLADFSRGLFALADRYGCGLAGGDTTRSPDGITISITALGTVPRGEQLLRDGARPGDDIWVSGELGDAAFALRLRRDEMADDPTRTPLNFDRLERPTPRIELGERLRGLASSAIDVSDGLVGDLRHVLEKSGVGARIDWPAVPRSARLRELADPLQRRFALTGGDDYELLFTAPAKRRGQIAQAGIDAGVALSRIGIIEAAGGLAVVDAAGAAVDTELDAYDHFLTGDH